ncbi:MAG: DoxX family protein [Planctomycetota bacterium]
MPGPGRRLPRHQGSNLAPWASVSIGLLEVLAAVLTIIPTTRLLGAGLISTIMMGAIGYHAMRAEWPLMAIPVAALAMALASLALELSLRKAEPAPAPALKR